MRSLRLQSLFVALGLSLVASCLDDTTAEPIPAQSDSPLLYGADDRQQPYEVHNPALRRAIDATVVLLNRSLLTPVEAADGSIEGYALDVESYINGDFWELCPDERFFDEPVPGHCSGVQVGPDLIATAGHCIDDRGDNYFRCENTVFVFGFEMIDEDTPRSFFETDDVYDCSELLGDRNTGNDDWAVVRTNREIAGHGAVAARQTGSVGVGDTVYISGHPLGLPMKVASGLVIPNTRNRREYFEAAIDDNLGNSGSGVFSIGRGSTLLLEGLLVRGNPDFDWDSALKCNHSNQCPDTGCSGKDGRGGEEVTRASQFVDLL